MQNALPAFFTGDLSEIERDALGIGDDRPFPTEPELMQLGHSTMTEALDVLLNSGLEDYTVIICEGIIGGLHNAAQRIQKEADKHGAEMRGIERDFDGSEVLDTQLQEATQRKRLADLAARSIELIRDSAAETFHVTTGQAWTPYRGSIRTSPVTAALVQARDVIRADQAAKANLMPAGARVIAFRAAPRTNSHTDSNRIFDALNWAYAQCPNMVLATTSAAGGEQIAISWAKQKKIPVIIEKPNFDRDGKAAPFKANDTLLKLNPVLCLTLPKSLEAPEGVEKAGPVLNIGQKATQQAVRHIEIA